ncbi:MAG: helix-turn-helix domain-containing protein [Hahellaceae bacterium]|nr:helix-turn-helix domain-containing protein [Hahellaceae bacterium]MCP5210028.1 helix-turn-helix domain-containing protein [Hahellaceae bacterium]
MPDQSEEIMTIEELAVYLKIPKSTLYKQAQEGKIPGQKIGKQWRFGRKAIDRWMNEDVFKYMFNGKELGE